MLKENEALILVITSVFAAAFGQILFKDAMRNIEISEMSDLFSLSVLIKIFSNGYILLGLFLYAGSTLLWLGALSKLDVSVAYPLVSLGYILTAIFALFFLHEKITSIRWLGIFLIVLGSILITKF
jgi:drug/metabolite transporter (DMT)-like permease